MEAGPRRDRRRDRGGTALHCKKWGGTEGGTEAGPHFIVKMGRDRTTPFGFYNNKKVWGGARQVHGALGDSRDHTFHIVVGAVLQMGCAFFRPPRSASPPPLESNLTNLTTT